MDFGVADDEGAGEIYSADIDLWIGTVGDFDLFSYKHVSDDDGKHCGVH